LANNPILLYYQKAVSGYRKPVSTDISFIRWALLSVGQLFLAFLEAPQKAEVIFFGEPSMAISITQTSRGFSSSPLSTGKIYSKSGARPRRARNR
jgi:hypothetical protein